MLNKRTIATAVLICFLLSFLSGAGAVQLTDVSGHWAGEIIQKWANDGVVSGYENGAFLPDNEITRAELAKIINNLFGYVKFADSAGTDVSDGAWYAPEMKKAVAAGYIAGYGDGTTAPEKLVTREEAAVMLSRAFSLRGGSDAVFTDGANIAAWAKEAVSALYADGGISGYPDGSFRPGANITRAEVIKIVDNLVALMIGQTGLYDFSENGGKRVIEGSLFVAAEDVVLKNAVVKGNLYVAPAVGESDAAFYNVTVEGDVIVQGGGISSVKFFGCSLLGVSITKQSPVRVLFDSGEANLIENLSEDSKIELAGGAAVGSVILAAKTDVAVASGSSILALEVTGEAQGTTVTGNGSVAEIITSTENITVGSGLQVQSITDNEGNNVEVEREEPIVITPPIPPVPSTSITVTDAADLQAALDNTQYTTIVISGTLGDTSSYETYRITRTITVKGATGVSADSVFGSFIIEADGVVFDGVKLCNKGSNASGSAHRNAINFLGNDITVRNCVFQSDGVTLANGISIFPRTSGAYAYTITGNTFVDYIKNHNGSLSAAILIGGNIPFSNGVPFINGGQPVTSASVDGINDMPFFTSNTFTNCATVYQRSDYALNNPYLCTATVDFSDFYLEFSGAAPDAIFYVAGDVTLNNNATVKADTELIILDGASLTLASGVVLAGTDSTSKLVFSGGATLVNSSGGSTVFDNALNAGADTTFTWNASQWEKQ